VCCPSGGVSTTTCHRCLLSMISNTNLYTQILRNDKNYSKLITFIIKVFSTSGCIEMELLHSYTDQCHAVHNFCHGHQTTTLPNAAAISCHAKPDLPLLCDGSQQNFCTKILHHHFLIHC